MKKKSFCVIFLSLILLARILTTEQSVKVMNHLFHRNSRPEAEAVTIAIDPGHGGWDPGKVGINNAKEKEINLAIAFKLKSLLEQKNIKVIMTREADVGLYSEGESNKKRSDLNNRVRLINSSGAVFAISIHQNSFTEEYVKGAQVFYYARSAEGKDLAELMQDKIKETLKDGNHRKAKANESYVLLTKTELPLVIVECGYLSNQKEAALLVTEEYQDKMAEAISVGILEYLKKGSGN